MLLMPPLALRKSVESAVFGHPAGRVVRDMNATEAFRLSSRAYSTLLREVSI